MTGMSEVPCHIALISDNEIVIHGLKSMLSAAEASVSVAGFRDLPGLPPADVTLVDVSLETEAEVAAVQGLIDGCCFGSVVLFGFDISPALAKKALLMGCRGCFDKSLSGAELIGALERVQGGDIVVSPSLVDSAITDVYGTVMLPVLLAGLSHRESEVISMITWGRTNNEIAEALYLSVNTVKYYVRSAYRKIGVDRRAQAVKWGMDYGMDKEHVRGVEEKTSVNRARDEKETMTPVS